VSSNGVHRTPRLSGVRIGRREGLGCGVVCVVDTGTRGGGFLGTSARSSSLVICVCVFAPSLVPLDHLASISLSAWNFGCTKLRPRLEVAVEAAVPIHSLGVCCTVLYQDRRLDTIL